MNKKLQSKITTAAVIAVASGIIGYGIFWRVASNPANAVVDEQIAQCLQGKDIKFYGAYWCPHCQEQKKILGGYLRSIKYIECTENPEVCTAAKVKAYPTWVFPDGTRKEGALPFAEILKLSACQ